MKIRFLVTSMLLSIIFLAQLCEENPTSSKNNTITDVDGNEYQIVKIGNQWWMAENLKVIHYRNGSEIPKVIDDTEWASLTTGAYCNYDNDDNNAVSHGRIYNFYAVIDSRNIAISGWHIPSDEEWKELEVYIGMSWSEANNNGWRGSGEGTKLKSINGWYNNGNGTDDYDFSIIPSGYRHYDGDYIGIGLFANIWSSTERDSQSASHRGFDWSQTGIGRGNSSKLRGFSVRLVKD